MERKSKSAHVEDYGEFKNIIRPTSKERGMALLRQGKYVEAVFLRPEWKHILLKHKFLTKIKIDGKRAYYRWGSLLKRARARTKD